MYAIIAFVLLTNQTVGRAVAPPDIDLRAYAKSVDKMKFTENKGQWNSKAKFLARTNVVDIWVTATGVVYDWHGATDRKNPSKRKNEAVGVDFVGATGKGIAKGLGIAPGVENYFLDKSRYIGIRSYASAEIQDLYPGIDLVTYFDKQERRPRYDLIVHPGADPNQIRMKYRGAKQVAVGKSSEVKYATSFGDVSEQRELAYQKGDHGADYRFMPRQVLEADGTVGFNVDGYQKDRTLVIDPLVWSTYLGGSSSEYLNAVKCDANGNTFVTGGTYSTDFPTTLGPVDTEGPAGFGDVFGFAAAYDSAGALKYATYIGSQADATGGSDAILQGESIAVDSTGSAYIGGEAGGSTFYSGGTSQGSFIAKLDPTGALVGHFDVADTSGFNGITGQFSRCQVAVSSSNTVYIVAAGTSGTDTFTGIGGFSPTLSLLYAKVVETPLSTANNAIAIDSTGDVYFAINASGTADNQSSFGYRQTINPSASADTVVYKYSANLTTFKAGTYLGATGDGVPQGLAISSTGDVFVSGFDDTGSFPTTVGALNTTGNTSPGNQVGWIAKLPGDLSALDAATMLGADNTYLIQGRLALDASDQPVVAAFVQGQIMLSPGTYQGTPSFIGVNQVSNDLTTLVYGSYLGPNSPLSYPSAGVDIDSSGHFVVAGLTASGSFPVVNAAQPNFGGGLDGFITAIDPTPGVPSVFNVTSDRVFPAIAGGVGKSMVVTVTFPNTSGTTVTLTSPSPDLVVSSPSVVEPAGVTSQDFTVTPPNDVTSEETISLSANITGGVAVPFVIYVEPFVQAMIFSRAAVRSGGAITGWVRVWELPETDQTLDLTFTSPDISVQPAATVTVHGLSEPNPPSLPYSDTFSGAVVYVDANQTITATASHAGISSNTSIFPIYGPALSTFAFTPSTVSNGATPSVTVNLTNPGASDQTFVLTSSNSSVCGDISVTVPAHSVTATLPGLATPSLYGTKKTGLTYMGTWGGVTCTSPLTILPQTITSATPDASVVEGASFNVTVNLAAPAVAGLQAQLTSNKPASVPTFLGSFNAGEMTHVFSVPSIITKLAAPTSVSVGCQLSAAGVLVGPVVNAKVSVTPAEVISLSLSSATIQSGSSATGTLNISPGYSGTSPTTVALSSNSGSATFYNSHGVQITSLTVNPGDTAPTFTIKTVRRTSNVVVTLTAVTPLGYPSKTAQLTITP